MLEVVIWMLFSAYFFTEAVFSEIKNMIHINPAYRTLKHASAKQALKEPSNTNGYFKVQKHSNMSLKTQSCSRDGKTICATVWFELFSYQLPVVYQKNKAL